MNAVPENGVVKCDQNASRVAGCAHDCAEALAQVGRRRDRRGSTPVVGVDETSASRSGGRLRITANVSTANSTPSPARLPNAIAPRRRVQQCREREDRDELAEPGRGCRSSAPCTGACCVGEPRRDHAQHAREHRGVAGAEQHAGEDRDADVRGERHHELADGHEDHADRDDRSRAVAVEQEPDRDLHERRTRPSWMHREHRQRRGIRIESHRRVDADRRERRAVRDRQDVRGDADPPDQPGAPRRSGQSGNGHGNPTSRSGGPPSVTGAPGYAGRRRPTPDGRAETRMLMRIIGAVLERSGTEAPYARLSPVPHRRTRTRRARER